MTDDATRYEYRLAMFDGDVFFGNIPVVREDQLEATRLLANESHPESFRHIVMRRAWLSDTMRWGPWKSRDEARRDGLKRIGELSERAGYE